MKLLAFYPNGLIFRNNNSYRPLILLFRCESQCKLQVLSTSEDQATRLAD